MCDRLVDAISSTRSEWGYRTVDDLVADASNSYLDPLSTLISVNAVLGEGNLFYPGVRIDAERDSFELGDGNRVGEGTRMDATNGGRLTIGNYNEIGPHSVVFLINRDGARTVVGDGTRLLGRVEIIGTCDLGTGAQILGDITAVNVTLAGGGCFDERDPDLRGAVLKGVGRAAGLSLGAGEVISGAGDFAHAAVERQSVHHPRVVDERA